MLERRSFLSGLAAVSTGAAGVVPARVVAAPLVNTTIQRLADEYAACHAREMAVSETWSAADARFHRIKPPAPEALFRADIDFNWLSGWHGVKRHDGRWWYGTDEAIAYIREHEVWIVPDSDLGQSIARRKTDILDAWEVWQRETEVARDASGLTGARRDYDAVQDDVIAIRTAIIALLSSDPAALSLKVRVLIDGLAFRDWRGTLDRFVETAIELEGGPWDEAVTASIVRDLVIAEMGGARA